MATIRTLSQLLAELPDNTSRLISPADSRDIAATAFGYVGGTDPGPNNDEADTAGLGAFFGQGSRWYNSALNRLWICLTGVPTAAVWAQITGPAGPPGPIGPVSFPPSSGMSPEDGEDAFPIPGQRGEQGIQGIQGDTGAPGLTIPPLEPDEGQDGHSVQGERGFKGDTGERGEAGLTIPPWEGDEPEQALVIPGPTGCQGERGLFIPPLAGEDGEDGRTIPGQAGGMGATGGTGQTGQAGVTIPAQDGEDAEEHLRGLPGPTLALLNPDTARCTNSAAQTLTSGTPAVLTFDTETWDSNGLHSIAAATSKITAVTDGKYLINGTALYAASAVGFRSLGINKNGATSYGSSTSVVNVGTSTTALNVTALIDLVAGDYVELIAAQNSGGNLNVTGQVFSALKVAA